VRDAKARDESGKAAEVNKQTEAQQEVVGKLHDGMAAIEKAGPEKYEDFETKISEAIEARGGEPLHPMVSIGIAVSPAGADIAYRLATDPRLRRTRSRSWRRPIPAPPRWNSASGRVSISTTRTTPTWT
jgi:hypothetical protein